MHDIAIVCQCLFCSDFFLQTVDHIEKLRNSTETQQELLHKRYTITYHRYQFLNCPTCNELCFEAKYRDLMQRTDIELVLSLSRIVRFDAEDRDWYSPESQEEEHRIFGNSITAPKTMVSMLYAAKTSGSSSALRSGPSSSLESTVTDDDDIMVDPFVYDLFSTAGPSHDENKPIMVKKTPKKSKRGKPRAQQPSDDFDAEMFVPLFVNLGENTGKPKWMLLSGVGPKRLELDNSRSGRIFKNSLRQFKLRAFSIPPYANKSEYTAEQFIAMSSKTVKAINTLASQGHYEQLLQFMQRIRSLCPLFDNYKEVESDIDTYCALSAMEDMSMS